jgi:NMD protein affecting ribosome stability and mRNA decay
MQKLTAPCERCGATLRISQYEANDGLCAKCAKKKYPEWAQDPRIDLRNCWYARPDDTFSQNRRVVPELYRVRL